MWGPRWGGGIRGLGCARGFTAVAVRGGLPRRLVGTLDRCASGGGGGFPNLLANCWRLGFGGRGACSRCCFAGRLRTVSLCVLRHAGRARWRATGAGLSVVRVWWRISGGTWWIGNVTASFRGIIGTPVVAKRRMVSRQSLSSQDADLCLMLPESEVRWGGTFPLSLRLARFRDNLMFFCPVQFVPYWTHHLKKFFTDLYELDLDFEQMGRSLTFLEVRVQCEGPNIRRALKNKVLAGYLTDNRAILRFPDPHTSTARDTVHGLAIALSKKAESITTDPPFTESNFSQVIWELKHGGYPTSWWVSLVRKAYLRSDAVTPWAELKENPRWIPPVAAKHCLLCPQYTPCLVPLPRHLSANLTSWLRLAEMSRLLKKACSSPPSMQNYEAHSFTFEAYFAPPPPIH